MVEEAESPWRKFRYFIYLSLGAAAGLSAFVELPRLAAGLSGINSDLLPNTVNNLAVSAGLFLVLGLLFQRDREAQLKKLEAIRVGGSISALRIMFPGTGERLRLSDLRSGRGRATRVVILAGPAPVLRDCLTTAQPIGSRLANNELLLVPVGLPDAETPPLDPALMTGPHVALPAGGDWRRFIDAECARAREQGLDPLRDGMAVIVKKNGRVGQRIAGMPPLGRIAADVEDRVARGMDVENV